MSVITSMASALSAQAFYFFEKGITLAASATCAFFGFRRYANHGEGILIAVDVAIQIAQECYRIAFIGFHLLPVLIPIVWTYDEVGDPHGFKLPVQGVTEAACFVAAVDLLSQMQLFGCKA